MVDNTKTHDLNNKVCYAPLKDYEFVSPYFGCSYHVHALDFYFLHFIQKTFRSLQTMVWSRFVGTGDFSIEAHYFVRPLEDMI